MHPVDAMAGPLAVLVLLALGAMLAWDLSRTFRWRRRNREAAALESLRRMRGPRALP